MDGEWRELREIRKKIEREVERERGGGEKGEVERDREGKWSEVERERGCEYEKAAER